MKGDSDPLNSPQMHTRNSSLRKAEGPPLLHGGGTTFMTLKRWDGEVVLLWMECSEGRKHSALEDVVLAPEEWMWRP